MYNENELPSSKRLELSLLFLSQVEQLTQAHGKEWVENILSLGGLISDTNNSCKNKLSNGLVLIDQVKALGIDISKQIKEENISDLIQRSTYAQVKTAIAKYKSEYLIKNKVYENKAEKLFFTILSNEQHK